MQKHIYVVGAGYVGLATAALYAEKGHLVSLYDKERAKRRLIASGKAPFFEPTLDELLAQTIENECLEVVEDPVPAVASADFSFVAVGTRSLRNGAVGLSEVVSACRDVGRGLKNKSVDYPVVAIRSTVFPGTTSGTVRETVERFSSRRAGADFGLVAYPEFLREGSAIHDMLHPDRVVLGEIDDRSGDAVENLVREFYRAPPPVVRVSSSAAEMIKYASNAFLATKIAFINEIANLCERFQGIDVEQVADGMGYDRRIGRAFLDAGLGFGGSCLPKDLRALVVGAGRERIRLRISEATLASNELQPLRVVRLARELVGSLKGKKAAVLGLAFKPGTSDMREAPSVKIVRSLLKAKMRVSVYDPRAMENAAAHFGKRVTYANGIRDCLEDADCCFIVTEWDEFKAIPSELFTGAMARPVVIDGRRALTPSELDRRIIYRAIGLGRGQVD